MSVKGIFRQLTVCPAPGMSGGNGAEREDREFVGLALPKRRNHSLEQLGPRECLMCGSDL